MFNNAGTAVIRRRGGWVYLDISVLTNPAARETWGTLIARLPVGYRPPEKIRAQCMISAQYWEAVAPGYVTICPDGIVNLDYRVAFSPQTCDVSVAFPLA